MRDLDILTDAFGAIGIGFTRDDGSPEPWDEVPKNTYYRIRQGTNNYLFDADGRYLGFDWMGSDECDHFDKPVTRKVTP